MSSGSKFGAKLKSHRKASWAKEFKDLIGEDTQQGAEFPCGD